MNKKLMASLGFDAEMMKVELGYCPTCNKEILMKDFVDELSLKEYNISGLCQTCQDNTFGKKEQPAGYDYSKVWHDNKSVLRHFMGNTISLFENTGINLRDKYLSELVITEGEQNIILFHAIFYGQFQIADAYAVQWYHKNKEKHATIGCKRITAVGSIAWSLPMHWANKATYADLDGSKCIVQVMEGDIV